jgi:hypothetical protein
VEAIEIFVAAHDFSIFEVEQEVIAVLIQLAICMFRIRVGTDGDAIFFGSNIGLPAMTGPVA